MNKINTWLFESFNMALQAADRQEQRFDEVIVVSTVVDGKTVYAVMAE